jgi:hypothetical protein
LNIVGRKIPLKEKKRNLPIRLEEIHPIAKEENASYEKEEILPK